MDKKNEKNFKEIREFVRRKMNNTERTMKYLENELSESERESFENDLKKDSNLMEEYKLHLELDEFLEKKFKEEEKL